MPGGLFAMLVLSYVVFRRARACSRSGSLWIALLWLFVVAGAFVSSVLAGLFVYFTNIAFASERDAIESLLIPTGIGMLAGAATCLWLVGRRAC